MLILHPPLTPPLKGGAYLLTLSPGGLRLAEERIREEVLQFMDRVYLKHSIS
jgi:hypothetical protein